MASSNKPIILFVAIAAIALTAIVIIMTKFSNSPAVLLAGTVAMILVIILTMTVIMACMKPSTQRAKIKLVNGRIRATNTDGHVDEYILGFTRTTEPGEQECPCGVKPTVFEDGIIRIGHLNGHIHDYNFSIEHSPDQAKSAGIKTSP